MTGLQPGSFIFMDVDHYRIGGECDLTIWDRGFKAFSADRPFGPGSRTLPDREWVWDGDKRGKLRLKAKPVPLKGLSHNAKR